MFRCLVFTLEISRKNVIQFCSSHNWNRNAQQIATGVKFTSFSPGQCTLIVASKILHQEEVSWLVIFQLVTKTAPICWSRPGLKSTSLMSKHKPHCLWPLLVNTGQWHERSWKREQIQTAASRTSAHHFPSCANGDSWRASHSSANLEQTQKTASDWCRAFQACQ